ncbi:Smr/MutS family protein [Legionella rubrilucens]|uniref:Smr/MutS family protein n=1 Tax=Legionella rubrilucens TaxID=458 RepID=UPI0030FF3921
MGVLVMADDGVSDQDKALFRQAMQSVKPLKKGKAKSVSEVIVPQHHTAPPKRTRREMPPPSAISLSSYYTNEVLAHTTLSYTSHGIPAKRFRELKTGAIHWQAKLDLHGLTTEDARETLLAFILRQYEAGHRSILIIHGKGGVHGEAPVLKNLVNHWLKQIPTVLAFHSARPKDGGTGALYVLLKRQRHD